MTRKKIPQIVAADYFGWGPSDYRMDLRRVLTKVAKGGGWEGSPDHLGGHCNLSDKEWLRLLGAGSYWTS